MTTRADGRRPDELREVKITRGWLAQAEGSVLVEFGNTRVMCTASVEFGVPRFKKDSGEGWLTQATAGSNDNDEHRHASAPARRRARLTIPSPRLRAGLHRSR